MRSGLLATLPVWVRRNGEVILAALNLAVFVVLVSSVVFVTQHGVNPKIQDFVDALYFSVATLSTTGFGDITLIGRTSGELSVGMMIVGISLFRRLAQTLFRPAARCATPARSAGCSATMGRRTLQGVAATC